LSGGRLNPGVSVGPPMHYDQVQTALYPDTGDVEDFGYERVRRLLGFVRGEPASDFSGTEGFEVFSDRVQPHSPGLDRRMWYGGASLRSAQWAGENGMNFLTSSVVKAEEPGDFAELQLVHIRAFRAHHHDGERARVSQGLVVIPTDSASPEQRRKYEEFARKRLPRTAEPQGPARLLFAPDLVGTSAQLAEQLWAHPAFREIDEVAFALPFTFDHEDYVQILTDMATRLGPVLGWQPATGTGT
jgi:alkanesulfonate monooxygenase SsuD/methylene tetrahydromethanopterin reductase-like flavin-dependent oxidoreductase (luciferase family)